MLFAKILLRTSQPVEAVPTNANAEVNSVVVAVPVRGPYKLTELK